jgi:hypothetical protein
LLKCPQVFDAPRFIWRGVLLDVGRHFFSVPFVMKLLDLMALYKMNRFHWHLTEDQVGTCVGASAGFPARVLLLSECCCCNSLERVAHRLVVQLWL